MFYPKLGIIAAGLLFLFGVLNVLMGFAVATGIATNIASESASYFGTRMLICT